MAIKNIIFDLGGVVIDLQRQRAVEALEKLGVQEAPSLLGEYAQQGVFLQLETGEIDASEFYDLLMDKCSPGTTCTDIRNAFEEFLMDIPAERLKILDGLKQKGYRLYVLSNTNPIMFNHWIRNEFRKDGKSINDYFDGIVASYQEGMCKPNPQLFQLLIDRYGLNPAETLMLDDSAANVQAAKSIGINAALINPQDPESLKKALQKVSDSK